MPRMIRSDKYINYSFVAEGGFGKVYQADCRKIGVAKAVKVITGRVKKYGRAAAEVELLQRCKHPNDAQAHPGSTDLFLDPGEDFGHFVRNARAALHAVEAMPRVEELVATAATRQEILVRQAPEVG